MDKTIKTRLEAVREAQKRSRLSLFASIMNA
jgi:hypothetical protein